MIAFSLCTYACVRTAQSDKVLFVLKEQPILFSDDCYWPLNHDDDNEELLIKLIAGLKSDLAGLKILLKK